AAPFPSRCTAHMIHCAHCSAEEAQELGEEFGVVGTPGTAGSAVDGGGMRDLQRYKGAGAAHAAVEVAARYPPGVAERQRARHERRENGYELSRRTGDRLVSLRSEVAAGCAEDSFCIGPTAD